METSLERIIYQGILAYQPTITLVCRDTAEALEIYSMVLRAHPELFWVGPGGKASGVKGKKNVPVQLYPSSNLSVQEIKGRRKELEDSVQSILSLMPQGLSAYQKLLFLHDYVAEHTEYDQKSVDDGVFLGPHHVSPDPGTAYGCLVRHSAVCEGFSKGLQLLLHRVGISCGCVVGKKRFNMESHMWNYVVLDGDSYYVDVTWDRAMNNALDQRFCSHAYFCLTTRELNQSHEIGKNDFIPSCTSKRYDYFRESGRYLARYDLPAMVEILSRLPPQKTVEIKFGNTLEAQRAVNELFEQKVIFRCNNSVGRISKAYYAVFKGAGIVRLTVL